MKLEITICITCVGGRLMYDIISAIRDADDYDIKIIGIDSDKTAAGRLLCDSFYVVPHAEKNASGWLEKIFYIHKKHKMNGLIAFSEGESRLVGKNRKLFKSHNIKTSINSNKIVKILTDKYLMLNYLKSHNLDVGKFNLVNSSDHFLEIAKKLGYPKKKVVFKPRYGRGSRGVLIADKKQKLFESLVPERFCGIASVDVLEEICKKNNISIKDYIAMPFYKGKVWDVDVLSKGGEVVNIAARIRQLRNPLWPTSTGHKVSYDTEVIKYVSKIIKVFKINGPSDYDIVLDDNGKPKVLDAAARYSGSVGVSYIAGVNMMSQLIRVMFNMPIKKYKLEDGMVLRPYITMAQILDKNENDYL
jgi:carbamoyl-phosphate synthase large subunit